MRNVAMSGQYPGRRHERTPCERRHERTKCEGCHEEITVKVLFLNERDVHALLEMPACIALMHEALATLGAR